MKLFVFTRCSKSAKLPIFQIFLSQQSTELSFTSVILNNVISTGSKAGYITTSLCTIVGCVQSACGMGLGPLVASVDAPRAFYMFSGTGDNIRCILAPQYHLRLDNRIPCLGNILLNNHLEKFRFQPFRKEEEEEEFFKDAKGFLF